jgi:fatty acid desaturase
MPAIVDTIRADRRWVGAPAGIYIGFTPLHEAMHGVAHASRWVNATIGRLGGTPLTISLPLFRGVHHEHHSHTNDAARDPDLVVAHRPRLLLPLWLLGVTVTYRLAFYRRRLWRSRSPGTATSASSRRRGRPSRRGVAGSAGR